MAAVPYIDKHRIRELALSLRLRGRGDYQECERIAARIVAREQREQAKSSPPPPAGKITAHNAADWLIAKIMRMVANATATAEFMQRGNLSAADKSKITPTPSDNPVVCDEPVQGSNRTLKDNVVPFPGPLVVTGNGGAQLIPDTEFAARYHDPVTEAWRASIQRNQEIAKEREVRSIQHRNQSKYVG
jgi:hypothetical protein